MPSDVALKAMNMIHRAILKISGGRVGYRTAGMPVVQLTTNRDGRCEGPLVEGERFAAGIWQLEFHVATYYRMRGTALADPPFLDVVPIRFGVADAAHHYHVPLLVTPWSYSTYRGS